jgi:hypothetical protein
MTAPVQKRCACGWLRPVIAITTRSGAPPREALIPIYACPKCGKSYVPDEIPEATARAILRSLMGSDPN